MMYEILKELERAKNVHPAWPTDPFHALAIVSEEHGELSKAIVDRVYENGAIEQVRLEAIQLAATSIRFCDNLEEYKFFMGERV